MLSKKLHNKIHGVLEMIFMIYIAALPGLTVLGFYNSDSIGLIGTGFQLLDAFMVFSLLFTFVMYFAILEIIKFPKEIGKMILAFFVPILQIVVAIILGGGSIWEYFIISFFIYTLGFFFMTGRKAWQGGADLLEMESWSITFLAFNFGSFTLLLGQGIVQGMGHPIAMFFVVTAAISQSSLLVKYVDNHRNDFNTGFCMMLGGILFFMAAPVLYATLGHWLSHHFF